MATSLSGICMSILCRTVGTARIISVNEMMGDSLTMCGRCCIIYGWDIGTHVAHPYVEVPHYYASVALARGASRLFAVPQRTERLIRRVQRGRGRAQITRGNSQLMKRQVDLKDIRSHICPHLLSAPQPHHGRGLIVKHCHTPCRLPMA